MPIGLPVPFRRHYFQCLGCRPLAYSQRKFSGSLDSSTTFLNPRGSSLNDGISPDNTRVSYSTVEDAIRRIKSVGPHRFLGKTDLRWLYIVFLPREE